MSWYSFICTYILPVKTCSVTLECCVTDLLFECLSVIRSEQADVHKQDNRCSSQPWQPWAFLFAMSLEDIVSAQLNLGLLDVHIPIRPLATLTVYWCWCLPKFELTVRTMNWKIYLKIDLSPRWPCMYACKLLFIHFLCAAACLLQWKPTDRDWRWAQHGATVTMLYASLARAVLHLVWSD